jgi:hypothetical protein
MLSCDEVHCHCPFFGVLCRGWVHFFIIMEGLREKEFIRKALIYALKCEKAQNFWTFSLY